MRGTVRLGKGAEHACRVAPPTFSNCGEQLAKDYSYEGAEVNEVSGHFYSDVLSSMFVTFKPDDFDRVMRALVDRYGKPDDLRTATLKDRAGATYENAIATWRKGDATLTVRKYANNINKADAVYISDSTIAEHKRREKEGGR